MSVPRERPIIMGAESVRAILEARKTQTRRVVKPQPTEAGCAHVTSDGYVCFFRGGTVESRSCDVGPIRSPYGIPGSRLWVRERFSIVEEGWEAPADRYHLCVEYADQHERRFDVSKEVWAKWECRVGRAYPSIHMPRWASRLTLEVKGVGVQRLREIHYDGIKAEGALPPHISGGERAVLQHKYFRPLWDALNAKRGYGWESNPWVWVVSFRRLEP